MTERLYYSDSYTTTFQATVIEQLQVDGRLALVLDRSSFYPSSGGQPHDTGSLNGIPVVDVLVRNDDAAILHILAKAPAPLLSSIQAGQQVEGHIDWSRRFDHMQHHTGQHILTQAFVQVANAKTVSFHLSPDSVTIDLDVTALPAAQVAEAEALANRIVQANRPVTATLRQSDDQNGIRIRKLPKHLLTDGLRIIQVENFDSTACGGTHVSRTGEIGLIKVLKLEKRGDKTRVEFRCGNRALADYADKHVVLNALAADMNCRYNEIPDMVNKLHSDLKTAQTALKDTRTQLTAYEADNLLATADRTDRYALVTAVFADRDMAEVRLLASRLTEQAKVVALLGAAGDKAQLVFARSADLSFDMGALLKEAAAKLGGRGGGQAAFAQGGGVKADVEALRNVIVETAALLKG
jgi:alanyl-tRNA synthetase